MESNQLFDHSSSAAGQSVPVGTAANAEPLAMSTRKKWVAIFLAYIGGVFGADRFYLGYRKIGLLKLFTFGGFGLLATADMLAIALNLLPDAEGRALQRQNFLF